LKETKPVISPSQTAGIKSLKATSDNHRHFAVQLGAPKTGL
jgi:hypothetical protein